MTTYAYQRSCLAFSAQHIHRFEFFIRHRESIARRRSSSMHFRVPGQRSFVYGGALELFLFELIPCRSLPVYQKYRLYLYVRFLAPAAVQFLSSRVSIEGLGVVTRGGVTEHDALPGWLACSRW